MARRPAPKRLQKRRDQKEVLHHVKAWREHRGLTQEQLAERVEKSRGLIGQIETGVTDLTEGMIYALANALSCTPGQLLEMDPSKEGKVIDILDLLRDASPSVHSEAIGYIKGLIRNAG